ncbi:MAG: hypothetical protein WC654_06945 [Patescibacteria group bacterium]
MSTFVRTSEEGGLTDSRGMQSRKLIDAGASTAQWDDILEGFVSDPAIFAAAVSHVAVANVAKAQLEELAKVKSIKGLRGLSKQITVGVVSTSDTSLLDFLTEVVAITKDGRAWLFLVAANLSALRGDTKLRPLTYNPRKEK